MGTMIDDELQPRPVKITAEEATARRKAAEIKLGVALKPSEYERSLHERAAEAQRSS